MQADDETLLQFPCEFPIKAMGKAEEGFAQLVLEIVRRHAPDTGDLSVRTKPSSNGNYLSVTIVVVATSKAQLDRIYLDMTAHPDILMAF